MRKYDGGKPPLCACTCHDIRSSIPIGSCRETRDIRLWQALIFRRDCVVFAEKNSLSEDSHICYCGMYRSEGESYVHAMAPTNPPKLSPVFHGLVKEVAFSRLIWQALRSGEGFPLGPSVISKAQNKKRLRRYSGVIESPPDPLEGVQSKSRCYVVGGVMQGPRNRNSILQNNNSRYNIINKTR